MKTPEHITSYTLPQSLVTEEGAVAISDVAITAWNITYVRCNLKKDTRFDQRCKVKQSDILFFMHIFF